MFDKLTTHNPLTSSARPDSRDDRIIEEPYREAETQEKLERLARLESRKSRDGGRPNESIREIEIVGARKLGNEEVGKLFD